MSFAKDQSPSAGAAAVLLAVKAVPGAKRTEVVGRLGDRLKVRIAAPPEDGKANAAICELLAQELGIRNRDVEVIRGASQPEKTIRILGVTAADIERRW